MRHMSNRRRGEVTVTIGGAPARLRLTLGALAELESALGAGDLARLGERLARGALSARDLQLILAAGLRGGGMKISDSEVAALPAAGLLPALVAAAAELLAVTFGVEAADGQGEGGRPFRRGRLTTRLARRFRGMRSWFSASGRCVLRRRLSGR